MSRVARTALRAVRALMLVIGVVAMHVTLLGGGPGCSIPTAGAGAGSDARAMAGMRMEDGTARAPDALATRVPVGTGASDHAPCDDTASKGCTSMAPCLFTMSRGTSAPASVERATASAISTLAVTLKSITTAPEFPPPRT